MDLEENAEAEPGDAPFNRRIVGILGIFYGFGYCPLTDWHWQVLHKLGIYELPSSYLEYLAERLTGLDFRTELVNDLTLLLFSAFLLISIGLNLRDYFKKKKS